MLGTLYPLVLDFIGAGKLSIGPPYFNAVFAPLMAILALFLGFGLLSQWKRTPVAQFNQQIRKFAVISVAAATVLTLVTGYEWDWFTWVAVLLGVWIIVVSASDVYRRCAAKQGSLRAKLSLGRSYYAMLFGHIGFAFMVIGAVVVSMHSIERDVRIVAGQMVTLGDYQLMFDSEEKIRGPNYEATRVNVRVLRDNSLVSVLSPEKRVYFSQSSPMTEAGIDPGFWRDIYVAIGEELGEGAWAVRVQYKPLVRWIWLGAIFMFIAGCIAVSDKRYRYHITKSKSADITGNLEVAK
ncbi:hypothetical protein A3744_20825 [Oleiphilus sp. HI0073]|nr:hypothetical protein A3744_20825 [Oleiphilus sp. HI0073]